MNNAVTIVGAGFTGATAARVLAERGWQVLVVEERDRVGGNAADTWTTHLYGPHIFHTNSASVFEWLSQFTEWRHYEHRVSAAVMGVGHVPMPVNFATLETLWPREAEMLKDVLCAAFTRGAQVPILRLRQHENDRIRNIGDAIWDVFFHGYTKKMWGMDPGKLSPGVTARVPIRLSRDDRYFTDDFQFQPREGYAALFERMLDHPLIEVRLDDKYDKRDIDGRVIFTGPVDKLFDYVGGALPYRTIRFETISTGGRVSAHSEYPATVNHPSLETWMTRDTQMGVVTGSGFNHVVREFPEAHVPGKNDPYYPIPVDSHRERWRDYEERAKKRGIILAGRLAEYKYYNMDQAVAAGMTAARKIIGGEA
jgi:UDP-galactopyranose mutase